MWVLTFYNAESTDYVGMEANRRGIYSVWVSIFPNTKSPNYLEMDADRYGIIECKYYNYLAFRALII